ncbi:MAG: hypothetical protein KF847_14080 [Pirellulales bacterium]|nr:hypothetical protein [Pirellulales bacterium]
MDNPDINDLIERVADENDADLYLYAGPVTYRAEREFNQTLRTNRSRKNAFCILTTYGGSADVAYQIVRSLQRFYSSGKFILFVDSICKSAGTLIAMGANGIVMSDTAELGPLDVQVLKPGELGELVSGLTPAQALETLRDALFASFEFYFLNLRERSQGQIATRTAAELAVELAVGSFKPIYEQFDPMRLGENERSVAIARAYGNRIKTENVKDDSIEALIKGYPSHGFVIDRDEAGQLFNCVRSPTESESLLAAALRPACEQALAWPSPVIRCIKVQSHDTSSQADCDSEQETEHSDEAGESGTANPDAVEPPDDGSAGEYGETDGGGHN